MTFTGVRTARTKKGGAGSCTEILDVRVSETVWMPGLWSTQETEGFVEDRIARNTMFCARRIGQAPGFKDRHNGWINYLYLASSERDPEVGIKYE